MAVALAAYLQSTTFALGVLGLLAVPVSLLGAARLEGPAGVVRLLVIVLGIAALVAVPLCS